MGRDALTGGSRAPRLADVLPDWLLWLLPVPVATLGAIVWVSWTSRTRGPQRPQDTVQEYERFRAALSAPPRRPPPATERRDER